MSGELYLHTVPIIDDDILGALQEIGDCDCDFNGENGLEYLREEAKGFKSNLDYILNKCSKLKDCDKIVKEFFDFFVAHDCYYYQYEYELIKDNDGKSIAIAFAYTTD